MTAGDQPKQIRLLKIKPGLFFLKYEKAADAAFPPRVDLSPEPGQPAPFEFVTPPGVKEASLAAPGAAVVLKCTGDGLLRVTVSPSVAGGSMAAEITMLPIEGELAAQPDMVRKDEASSDPLNLILRGHVSRLGDKTAERGGWLGGPDAPYPIEGVVFDWPHAPADVSLECIIRIGGRRPLASKWVAPGTFVGTRGGAQPLVCLGLRLSGRGAAGLLITGEALFMGGHRESYKGNHMLIGGPTGLEPIVGLRFALERREAPATANPVGETPQSRVKVFRRPPG